YSFTTEQRAACLHATFGDTGNNFGDLFRDYLANSNVVLHKQWLRTADNQVIHAHGHQVNADGVMLVHGLSDGEFGAHAIRARGQERLFVLTKFEETGKTTEPAHDLGARCALC